LDKGNFVVKHKIPYSDIKVYGEDKLRAEDRPAEFGHALTDQLAGQTEAGLAIVGVYEDRHTGIILSQHIPTYMATRAVKL